MSKEECVEDAVTGHNICRTDNVTFFDIKTRSTRSALEDVTPLLLRRPDASTVEFNKGLVCWMHECANVRVPDVHGELVRGARYIWKVRHVYDQLRPLDLAE